jgi:hypothetical protein
MTHKRSDLAWDMDPEPEPEGHSKCLGIQKDKSFGSDQILFHNIVNTVPVP